MDMKVRFFLVTGQKSIPNYHRQFSMHVHLNFVFVYRLWNIHESEQFLNWDPAKALNSVLRFSKGRNFADIYILQE